MAYFLAKTDPACYSIADLERDRRTEWEGVRNPQAVRAIKQMQPSDLVFVYHSQGESSIVGLARVVSDPRPDPSEPKSWLMDVEFIRRLAPVSLKEIKVSARFDDWELVRQSRLSTMPAPDSFVAWMRERGADVQDEVRSTERAGPPHSVLSTQ